MIINLWGYFIAAKVIILLLEDTTTESMLFVTFIVIIFNLWIIMDGVDGFIIKKYKIFLKTHICNLNLNIVNMLFNATSIHFTLCYVII